MQLPKETTNKEYIAYKLKQFKNSQPNPKDGKMFGYVFYANEQIEEIIKLAYNEFLNENGIAPTVFTSLKKMENDIVQITANQLNGGNTVVGNLTSGGTESLLLAVKTARDYAKTIHPTITQPEIILPVTAHSSFFKAAAYFNVKPIIVPVDHDFKINIPAVRNAINENTILLVGSAPNYSQGVMDDIEALSRLAQQYNILLHVDACMGGWILPTMREMGYIIPPFDFKLDGVTSISVDLHKYAYTAKGCSVLLWKNNDLRKQQYFACNEWTGYALVNPTMTSTKPGGSIAAAWAVLHYLGKEGYQKITKQTLIATDTLITEIPKIDGLYILGKPISTLIAFGSKKYNIHKIADELTEMGWTVTPQLANGEVPASIHLTITFSNVPQINKFIQDLKNAVEKVSKFSLKNMKDSVTISTAKKLIENLSPENLDKLLLLVGIGKGQEAPKNLAMISGLMEIAPKSLVKQLLLDFFIEMYTPNK